MGRKKKSKFYFTQETENAIIEYNKCDDPVIKNKIYSERIAYAFDKLVENIIHTFKFYYFDSSAEYVKYEVVSFLVLNMHKYQEGKGKAFSYFGQVTKNYLILHNNNNYKKLKIHDQINVLDYKRNVGSEHSLLDQSEMSREFIGQMLEFWNINMTNIFKRQKDILVADSILEIFRRSDNIENYNKKALYILIREMTGSNTQHITRIINIMKKYYNRLFGEYYSYGKLNTSNTGSMILPMN